jgi:hypothetical protein
MKTFRMAAWLLAATVASGIACGPAGAQEKPDLFVLSVGIDSYQAPTNNLRGCVNDAAGMAKVLRGQEGKRFGRVDAVTLTNAEASKSAIAKSLNDLESKGRPGDWYVLVLSGHGGIRREQWDFLTQDNQAMSDAAILGAADRLAGDGKKVAVIIDACHAGVLRYAAGRVLNRHTDPAKGGIILMVSSMPDQLSSALGSYSAFARAVEDGLEGMADYDGDGVVTLKELRRFTYNRVYELCLLQRPFPGITVSYQDSAIDASLSVPENIGLVYAKKSVKKRPPDDGDEVKPSPLVGRTWTVASPGSQQAAPITFELKLDRDATYRATLKRGIQPLTISTGTYKVTAKAVRLTHHQGVDRLEVVALAPGEFRFRFHDREFTARSVSRGPPVVDVSGRLLPEDPRDRVRKQSPRKTYRLRMDAGMTYVIDLQSADFDAFLRLEDASGNQVAEDDDGGGGRNARIRYSPTRAGEYRIIATTYSGGSGVYNLHVEKIAGPRPAERPLPTNNILNIAERLSETDPHDRVRTDSFARAYKVQLKAGVTYTIDLISSDFDTYLRLENDAGVQVAVDDDGGDGLNARIVYTPTRSGTYRILATSYKRATGRFTLTVSAPGFSPPAGTGVAVDLKDGSAVIDDRLAATDALDTSRTNSYRKVFLVKLRAGKECTVFLKSRAIDAYLRIEDGSGRELARDDDSGGGHDARIVFVPRSNSVFRIIATSFDERATGPFNLSIEQR